MTASDIVLSSTAVREILLARFGLLQPLPQNPGKVDILTIIRQLGILQIDTIHRVARAPYFILWSRLGMYQPVWLDELLEEHSIFEYWAHAACFIPIEDFPLFRRVMLDGSSFWWNSHKWLESHQEEADQILERIRKNGSIRSSDFEGTKAHNGGWWNWKPEKMALEHLFNLGMIMVSRREKFQRCYDLRERIYPGWDDLNTPSRVDMIRTLTLRTVKILGVALPAWVPDYYRLPRKEALAALVDLEKRDEILPCRIEGKEPVAYYHPDHTGLIQDALCRRLSPQRTTLLSPFDPLVWDRKRTLQTFGFDFSLECYLPAAKRRYGYFSLPLLHRSRLVGRVEARALRKEKVFEIVSIHLEPDFTFDNEFLDACAAAIADCARWHQTDKVALLITDPPELKAPLATALGQMIELSLPTNS